MTGNNRIFYACQAVGIKRCSQTDVDVSKITVIHGVQSVGTNTAFNIEQIFELGMVQTYEAIEGLAEVEVTLEKILDGYPLMYHLASSNPSSLGLIGRTKEQCCLSLGIYSDSLDVVSGVAPVEMYCSGLYISSVSYSLPVEGSCTESLTLVGNNKTWFSGGAPNGVGFDGGILGDGRTLASGYKVQADFTGADQPAALVALNGGVQQRENVLMAASILPTVIYGIVGNAVGNNWDGSGPIAHIQSVSISTDTGREDILELGRKTPYYRPASFPIEVTCEIEAISISGDWISAYENGNPAYNGTINEGNNTSVDTIEIVLSDGTVFDLGSKNRLSSVSYGGGDTGGGNATMTYSFTNFNDFRILHPVDPASGIYSASDQSKMDRSGFESYSGIVYDFA